MDKQKIFQYVVLGIFVAVGILGVIALSQCWGCENDSTVAITSPTVIWGPPLGGAGIKNVIEREITEKSNTGKIFEKTSYIEKNPQTLYTDLLEAIATGRGPDAVVVDSSMLLPLIDKISMRAYDSFPLLTYQQTYVDGADIFTRNDGIYAYPIVVDPLVLYWNRDLFTNAGIALVPENWETFLTTTPALTVIEAGKNIRQSSIAFGEYENVLHAKEILSALLFQTGVDVVQYRDGAYYSDLSQSSGNVPRNVDPVAAIRFYTDFSNPNKKVYSWNKTFTRSREAFASNIVAMYAGLVSERNVLEQINPNLNYSVAMWPQSVTGKNRATYGKFYGIAVLKSSQNTSTAHLVAQTIASASLATKLATETGLPTTHRGALTEIPNDPFQNIAVRSALISRDWLQPDQAQVDESVRRLIENGKIDFLKATQTFTDDLNAMLERYNRTNN